METIILAILGVVLAALILYGLWREMTAADRRGREAVEDALIQTGLQMAMEGLQPAREWPSSPPAPVRPQTIEEIHRRYEGMKDVDPKRAALRMYEEQLEIHGR